MQPGLNCGLPLGQLETPDDQHIVGRKGRSPIVYVTASQARNDRRVEDGPSGSSGVLLAEAGGAVLSVSVDDDHPMTILQRLGPRAPRLIAPFGSINSVLGGCCGGFRTPSRGQRSALTFPSGHRLLSASADGDHGAQGAEHRRERGHHGPLRLAPRRQVQSDSEEEVGNDHPGRRGRTPSGIPGDTRSARARTTAARNA